MALTEAKKKDLKDKKFDVLFQKHSQEWQTLAKNAHDFAQQHIAAGGSEPLSDDILKVLIPMLEVNAPLRKHQEDNRARFGKFRVAFGEYIIEQFYP